MVNFEPQMWHTTPHERCDGDFWMSEFKDVARCHLVLSSSQGSRYVVHGDLGVLKDLGVSRGDNLGDLGVGVALG